MLAGIRNDITSHQGLVRLHGIIGSKLYTVDTGSRNVIFHPKLYLVCGKTRARLVVGSANLTLGGLNNNIEAGMMLDFDLTDKADKAVVDSIESQLAAFPTDYPSHVVKVGALADLDEMLASGRLVDEMAVSPPRPTTSAGGAGASDTVPRIKLKGDTAAPCFNEGTSGAKAEAYEICNTGQTGAPALGCPRNGRR